LVTGKSLSDNEGDRVTGETGGNGRDTELKWWDDDEKASDI
jgi:hypothetical protein